ncbi:hypothetical protein PGT21_009382 [Puccinia graminis f. sp. tritici]|uniref:Uncharacterized protein n=1 Tax=Puccinia graminis f. sp. tritici TaxID=56615 RepID=A0A5B0NTU2_PUCGR|nr:hypothetical protein PGT21_009382 [Puccinia graminis f. sp. tritici]KAA1093740.1 hypothetical protein PGTUg99_025073 [Puccinia graminis f. sp. tritici]
MDGGKVTHSKTASRPVKDLTDVPLAADLATNLAAPQGCNDNNTSKTRETEDQGDSKGEESFDLIIQVPGDVAARTMIPPTQETVYEPPKICDVQPENPPVDPKLAETELEDNLIYTVGAVTSHQDIGFTPYFNDNICKLKAPL